MTELRIWTARHTVRIAAPPKRVFDLVASVDRWPVLFGSIRELNPKRLRVRFRQTDVAAPLASMGGLWLVVPTCRGDSEIALDHYYRVMDDSPATAAGVEQDIDAGCLSLLATIRRTAEHGGMADLIKSC